MDRKRKRSSKYSGPNYAKRSRTLPVVETKRVNQFLTTMGFDSIASNWVEYDVLGPIAQGTDYSNRIGRRIALKWVRFQAALFGGASGAGGFDDYYNTLRMVVYIGNYAKTGAAITPLATTGIGMNQPLRSVVVAGHRKTLLDKYHAIINQPYGANLAAAGSKVVEFFYRFKKPLIVEYSGSATQTNNTSLFFAAISDSLGVPNPGFTHGYCEIGFTDS